jgi:hypothetical protein
MVILPSVATNYAVAGQPRLRPQAGGYPERKLGKQAFDGAHRKITQAALGVQAQRRPKSSRATQLSAG